MSILKKDGVDLDHLVANCYACGRCERGDGMVLREGDVNRFARNCLDVCVRIKMEEGAVVRERVAVKLHRTRGSSFCLNLKSLRCLRCAAIW